MKTQTSKTTKKCSRKHLVKHLVCCTAAALAGLAMTNSADAAIRVGSTDFGFTGITLAAGSTQYNTNPLNFGDDGFDDIAFSLHHGSPGTPNDDWFGIKELNAVTLFSSSSAVNTGFMSNPLRAFNLNDPITGAAPTSYPNQNTFGVAGAYLANDASAINTFNAAGKYLGLQTSAGHLGWLEVRITPVGDELSVNIIDYGFDDSGAAIGAGATPEPATLVLMAAGLPALLKRKRKSR
jgi:hypothetical protein